MGHEGQLRALHSSTNFQVQPFPSFKELQHLKFGAYSITHTGFSGREQEILHPAELPENTDKETQWMWQSALHLPLTSLFSTDRILRWLLTQPSVKWVSLYIKYMIS